MINLIICSISDHQNQFFIFDAASGTGLSAGLLELARYLLNSYTIIQKVVGDKGHEVYKRIWKLQRMVPYLYKCYPTNFIINLNLTL